MSKGGLLQLISRLCADQKMVRYHQSTGYGVMPDGPSAIIRLASRFWHSICQYHYKDKWDGLAFLPVDATAKSDYRHGSAIMTARIKTLGNARILRQLAFAQS